MKLFFFWIAFTQKIARWYLRKLSWQKAPHELVCQAHFNNCSLRIAIKTDASLRHNNPICMTRHPFNIPSPLKVKDSFSGKANNTISIVRSKMTRADPKMEKEALDKDDQRELWWCSSTAWISKSFWPITFSDPTEILRDFRSGFIFLFRLPYFK